MVFKSRVSVGVLVGVTFLLIGATRPTLAGMSGPAGGTTSAACTAGKAAIDSMKGTYATNAALYNTTLAMLEAAPIEAAQKGASSAGKSLHEALPTLDVAVEKLGKILFHKDGDERKIIDWIIFGGDLSEALTDLQPRLEALMPLLTKLDDPDEGLSGLGVSLGMLKTAASGLSPLATTLTSCEQYNAAKEAFPKLQTLSTTGLDSVSRALVISKLVQKRSKDILNALKSAQSSFDPARARAKKLVGDDLDATERRTAVVFVPAAALIYSGEFLKDKLHIGKDRLRTFAGVSESDWGLFHMKSNSNAVARGVRDAIFPKISSTEETVDTMTATMKSYDSKLPGIVTQLSNAETGLKAVVPKLKAASFPATPCQACWF